MNISVPDHSLLRPIASGAYGEVWLARNAVGTLRAVKIVRRDQHASVDSFEREFKGLQKFEPVSRTHDGLVDILTLGLLPDGAGFYYVMELADDAVGSGDLALGPGESPAPDARRQIPEPRAYAPRTLRAELKSRGALPADEVIALGLKLTAALAHLHAQGLVHRDVKPSNIIFIGGEPKLADAGLVAAVDDARSLVGTAGYIAPEGPGTPQADLYALGKVLYEAAFGKDRQEFPALPADVASRSDHARLLEVNAVLLKACAADHRERYQSADQMRADLELLRAGCSVKRRQAWQEARRLAVRLGAAAAVIIAAWFLFHRLNDSTLQSSTASTSASIFVLPFRNDGTNGNDGRASLADRATDAFIESLKQINGATVAPRREELGWRPEAEARAEAAKLFAVRYVLAGNVKMGDSNTLALTLHDLASGRMVWSQSFTSATGRLVPAEMEVVHALAKALHVTITPDAEQRIGQKLSNNLAAWKLVDQADKVSLHLRERDDINALFQQYNEALQLDPDYAGALTGKAQLLRNMSGDRAPNDIWPEIKTCGERMLQIDPTSRMGQYFVWATKFLFEWDWEGAEKIFQERQALHSDWPVMVALYLRMVGRFDEARVEQEKVKGLDQRNLVVRNHSTAAAFIERDYPKTIELARESQAMFPGSLHGLDWLFHGYYHLGRFEQALETVRQRRRSIDEPLVMALEACALAKLRQPEAALKFLADLEARSADRYVDAYPLAWIHLALGDKPAALAKLRKACEQRSEFLVLPDLLAGGLRTDPKLDELREEPEFQELLKLTGLDVWPKPAAAK